MKQQISQSMWRFQQYYQNYIENYAKNLFRKLSPKLVPDIFLLGVLKEETQSEPVCLEPEDCGITAEQLKEVNMLAKKLYDEDPRKDKLHSVPYINENYQEDLRIKNSCQAVQQLIDRHFKPLKKISFVSSPVKVNKHEIFVILAYSSYLENRLFY